MDRETCLQKSHSAQNLASHCKFGGGTLSPLLSVSPSSGFIFSLRSDENQLRIILVVPDFHSPTPCSDQGESRRRSQDRGLDRDPPRTCFQFSSPSSGSPKSPQSPLPWESPKLKAQHSYMNPTASSMAKSSRSSSLGEGIHVGSPPRSPSFTSRASSAELEVEPPLIPSSPVGPSSCPLARSPSAAPHPTAAVSPIPFTQNAPPSRIPLPKQPLSARRSLCFEVKQNPSWSGGSARASVPAAPGHRPGQTTIHVVGG